MKISFFLKLVILALFFAPLSIQAQNTPTNVMQMTKIDLAANPNARIITTKSTKNSQYTTPNDLKTFVSTSGVQILVVENVDDSSNIRDANSDYQNALFLYEGNIYQQNTDGQKKRFAGKITLYDSVVTPT